MQNPRRASRAAWIVVAVVAAAGLLPSPVVADWTDRVGPVPQSPSAPVTGLPAPPAAPQPAPTALPPNWQELAAKMTLADVVDVALANNLSTRATWLAARSQAAQVGSKRAAYYPTANLSADVTRSQQAALGGQATFRQTTYGPSLALSYLLLDFGGRAAAVEEARNALFAADWQHNAAIQGVVLEVEQAYYGYLDAKGQLAAADDSLREARVNLEAAQLRHQVGVATVADVLQAKTAQSQALLVQQTLAGQIETLRGGLATAMGIPANTPFDVGLLPGAVQVEAVGEAAETLIDAALAARPDLAGARWQAAKAATHIRSVKAEVYPVVAFTGELGRSYYDPRRYVAYANGWSATLSVKVPLFTGFANTYNVRQAEADADFGQNQADILAQQVILDVWTAYSNLKTAAQQVATSKDLLASAEESERVALGRYREGVGTIIDLLTAQATLSSARAQEVHARSGWLVAAARLAFATGTLGPPRGEANPILAE